MDTKEQQSVSRKQETLSPVRITKNDSGIYDNETKINNLSSMEFVK